MLTFRERLTITTAFKNKSAALRHLKDQGLKISQGKLYNDANAGLLKVQPNGSILENDLEHYARTCIDVPPQVENDEDLLIQKTRLEVEKLQNQVRDQNCKYGIFIGQYIPRVEIEPMLANRLSVLEASLRHFVMELAEFVESDRVSEFMAIADKGLSICLNDLADTEQINLTYEAA